MWHDPCVFVVSVLYLYCVLQLLMFWFQNVVIYHPIAISEQTKPCLLQIGADLARVNVPKLGIISWARKARDAFLGESYLGSILRVLRADLVAETCFYHAANVSHMHSVYCLLHLQHFQWTYYTYNYAQTVVCNTIFLQFSMLYIYTHVGDETARVSCPVIRSAIVTWSYVT